MTDRDTHRVEAVDADAIEAVLAFLPYFADQGNTFYSVDPAGAFFDPDVYSNEVEQFIQVLYDRGFIQSFPWPDWQRSAERYVEHPDRLARARLPTLQKLLTTHVRKERFCSGQLASMIHSGHILAILQRLDTVHRGSGDGDDATTCLDRRVDV